VNVQCHVCRDAGLDVGDGILWTVREGLSLRGKGKANLAHVVQITVTDNSNLHDIEPPALACNGNRAFFWGGRIPEYRGVTHVEPSDVEVLFELPKVGAMGGVSKGIDNGKKGDVLG
jgi:hypothetical protein